MAGAVAAWAVAEVEIEGRVGSSLGHSLMVARVIPPDPAESGG
jgi:hypothetical protein